MTRNLRAVIVDDEFNAVEALEKSLIEYCPQVEIVAKAYSADEGYQKIVLTQPDVVFLDIQMPPSSGFDLLTRFLSPEFKVIFVTAFDIYAINAIKFSALDYLLKPVTPSDLRRAIAKALVQIKGKRLNDDLKNLLHNLQNPKNRKNKVNIPTQNGIELIEIKQIIRCEAVNGFTILYLVSGKQLVSSRDLKFYQEVLEEYDFYRIHDSHLISYFHINKVLTSDGGVVLTTDNAQIPIARRRKSEFMDWLKSF